MDVLISCVILKNLRLRLEIDSDGLFHKPLLAALFYYYRNVVNPLHIKKYDLRNDK